MNFVNGASTIVECSNACGGVRGVGPVGHCQAIPRRTAKTPGTHSTFGPSGNASPPQLTVMSRPMGRPRDPQPVKACRKPDQEWLLRRTRGFLHAAPVVMAQNRLKAGGVVFELLGKSVRQAAKRPVRPDPVRLRQ